MEKRRPQFRRRAAAADGDDVVVDSTSGNAAPAPADATPAAASSDPSAASSDVAGAVAAPLKAAAPKAARPAATGGQPSASKLSFADDAEVRMPAPVCDTTDPAPDRAPHIRAPQQEADVPAVRLKKTVASQAAAQTGKIVVPVYGLVPYLPRTHARAHSHTQLRPWALFLTTQQGAAGARGGGGTECRARPLGVRTRRPGGPARRVVPPAHLR